MKKTYGRHTVLDALQLRVDQGEAIGLLGANGTGKTTLLKLLLGLMPASGGRALIGGDDSSALSPATRERLGYVPQTPMQFPWLTGAAMLRYVGAFYPRFDWDQVRSLAQRWQLSLKTPIRALSPGHQQRLSIVRALGSSPDYLVMDEPISALDPATRSGVVDELVRIHRERRISMIFSSHITGDLERLCTQFIVLGRGGVVLQESADGCRSMVRVILSGNEDRLASLDFPGSRHVRRSQFGERIVVSDLAAAEALRAQLPVDVKSSIERCSLETLLSEWMH